MRRAAREALRRGADQIKVMASGGAASPTDELDHVQYSVDELSAAVGVARGVGTYVLAHAYGPGAIQACLRAGVRSIEHGNFLDEETADQMLSQSDTYLVPTVITYELLSHLEAGNGWTADNVRKIRQALTGAYDALGLAYEKGLRIGSGSDVLADMQGEKGKEIACQARIMGAMNAIVAATRTNAQLLRMEQEVGTLEEGKRADLIVLDADPLANPDIFGQANHVRLVVLGGEVVKDLDGGTPATALPQQGRATVPNGLLHFGLVHDAEPRPRLGLEPLVTDRLAALLTGPVATILDALEDVLDIVELGFEHGEGRQVSLPFEGLGPQLASMLIDLRQLAVLDDVGDMTA